MATAALSPAATSLRLKPFSSNVRHLSFFHRHQPKPTILTYQIIATPHYLSKIHIHFNHLHTPRIHRLCFSTVVSAAVSSGEAAEKSVKESFAGKVGEFRKRLRIVDIKGGQDEGLDKLGQTVTFRGWVRTLRVQSSVTFIGVGMSDPSFPIQKKRVSREFLRSKAHLRPRTNTFGAVARVRNALAYATHKLLSRKWECLDLKSYYHCFRL